MHYNSFQYSFRIWLTAALAVPHIYILYFFASRGISAYLPLGGYVVLMLESILVSMPVGFVFFMMLGIICKTNASLMVKKLMAFGALELLMFLLFAVLIHGFGGRATTWSSYFEFVVISSVVIAASVFFYRLGPTKGQKPRMFF